MSRLLLNIEDRMSDCYYPVPEKVTQSVTTVQSQLSDMQKAHQSSPRRQDKHQQQRSMALVVSSLRDQAHYEIRTISKTIAIIHRAIRESDSYENQKRLGAIIGELTSLAHLIETEVEHNINHSFDTSETNVEKHSSIV